MQYDKGQQVQFTAQFNCELEGEPYLDGDVVTIQLATDWDDRDGQGEGGPWGWGGYTSRFIASLGSFVH